MTFNSLQEYAEKVKSNGHFHYRTTPYGFEWNGENGSNLHTPESERSLPKTIANYRPLGISNENYGNIAHLAVLRAGSLAEYMRTHALMTDALAARKAFEVESIQLRKSFLLPGDALFAETVHFSSQLYVFVKQIADGRSMRIGGAFELYSLWIH